jgi:tetratricopeptide (TPR) repeat protein
MLESDEVGFANFVASFIEGRYLFLRYCEQFYSSDELIPDLSVTWTPWAGTYYEDFSSRIADETLREIVHSLVVHSNQVVHLNDQLAVTFRDYFGRQKPASLEEDFSFAREINEHRKSVGPSWLEEPGIVELVQKTQNLRLTIQELKPLLERELNRVYGHLVVTKEQFGDQRAKDLIDQAEGEFNLHRAIKLLVEALEYGDTGIQASKAHLGLGMRYEELNEYDKAIEHYTKAMDALEPFSRVLYWRGRLYYEQGQWDEARKDLEQALAFPSGEMLDSFEREEAKELLTEARKRTKST